MGNTGDDGLPQSIARRVRVANRAATAASGVFLQVHEAAAIDTQVQSW